MAESMFEAAPTTKSRKTWRMVVIGAAVPFAMLAAAPAVTAAEAEQLPPAPVPGAPDPQALLDLEQCLTDVQALLPADAPAPAELPAEAEQLPPAPAPAVPDVAALNETCQQILATLQGAAPAPAPAPADAPVDLP
ncbi:hypothetical protein LO763_26090 [Glycomyces sp. A-F 0318]|uniref:hypothetical protein n=1 Tax=Glycomyces amatae TaxID=2881355 RepID=UPI001E4292DC|nr:hypothetical protein [Glycomyces amatae]MCD0447093.1 hypothetical protein [Glycomyces amatae]